MERFKSREKLVYHPQLTEKFYSELQNRKLLNGDLINIASLLKTYTPTQHNEELFKCIDLFR